MIVFAAQLSQHFQAPPNHNHVINAFEETSRPWHTDVANNPLAKTSRNENLTFGNNTNRSYNSLLAADELSIKSDLFKNNDKYEERLANIGKPGKRTPLKSPSPVNVPAPVAPPTIMRESSKDQETISDMFLDIDLQGVESESRNEVDPNMPYIPSPDYTPLNSPIPVAKKAKGSYGNTSSTLF
ncbi:hypothetical protein HHI36_020864 [Cryptolaemus montrouzieri]|uniref:Uncharacterized protein n=1 Tax=Cryptolaemus montrouzieri TaxID=559131 RepID=A0ABD2NCD8_9CUCU